MNVFVVICTHNRAESLRVTLESLAATRVPAELTWELLVVGNATIDSTPEVVASFAGRLPLRYLTEDRQGKSFALNRAIPETRGEVVAFTDDDVTIDTDWLAALWQVFQSEGYDGMGGRIVPVWSVPRPEWYVESGPYRLMDGVVVSYDYGNERREIAMVPFGANMAFRRAVFSRYGLFATDLGPTGRLLLRGEDTEFGQRVRNGGGRIVYEPRALVFHPVEPQRATRSYFRSWYYQFGIRDVRVQPPPEGTVRWFGVPRYHFRNFMTAVFAWMTSLDRRARFFHQLNGLRMFGRIMESRRAWRARG